MELKVRVIILSVAVLVVSLASTYTASILLYRQGLREMDKSLTVAAESFVNQIQTQRSRDEMELTNIALDSEVIQYMKKYLALKDNPKKQDIVMQEVHTNLISIMEQIYPSEETSKKSLKSGLSIEVLTPEAFILADQQHPKIYGEYKPEFVFPTSENPKDVIYGTWGGANIFLYTASRINDDANTYGWVMGSRPIDANQLVNWSQHAHAHITILNGQRILGTTLAQDVVMDNMSTILSSTGIFALGGRNGIVASIFGLREYRVVKADDPAKTGILFVLSVPTNDLAESLSLITMVSIIFSAILMALTLGLSLWFLRSVNDNLRYPLLILKRGLEGKFEPDAPPTRLPYPFGELAANAYNVVMRVRTETRSSRVAVKGKPSSVVDGVMKDVLPQPPPIPMNVPQAPFVTSSEEAAINQVSASANLAESDPLGIFSLKSKEGTQSDQETTDWQGATSPKMKLPSSELTQPQLTRPIKQPDFLKGESSESAFQLGTMDDALNLPPVVHQQEQEEPVSFTQEKTVMASPDILQEVSENEAEEPLSYDQEKTMVATTDQVAAVLGDSNASKPALDTLKTADNGDDAPKQSINEILGSLGAAVTYQPEQASQAPSAEEEGSADPGATRVLQVPEGFFNKQPVIDEDPFIEQAKDIFAEYIELRKKLGEKVEHLVFEKFLDQLKKNRETILSKHKCKSVKFSIYEKDGKAALKAVPVN